MFDNWDRSLLRSPIVDPSVSPFETCCPCFVFTLSVRAWLAILSKSRFFLWIWKIYKCILKIHIKMVFLNSPGNREVWWDDVSFTHSDWHQRSRKKISDVYLETQVWHHMGPVHNFCMDSYYTQHSACVICMASAIGMHFKCGLHWLS